MDGEGFADLPYFWSTHGGFTPLISHQAPDTQLGSYLGYIQPTVLVGILQYTGGIQSGGCVWSGVHST